MTFKPNRKQSKQIRLAGQLTVHINGQALVLSDNFKLQTDLTFSGMTAQEQHTALDAYHTALAGKAEISFSAKLDPVEIKSKNQAQEPNAIDLALQDLNKASEVDLVAASVKQDEEDQASVDTAVALLNFTKRKPV